MASPRKAPLAPEPTQEADQPRRRRALPADERRQELMAAATEAFLQLGYEETRISDIVERAGVAQGTFYLHFPSKAAIYLAIAGELTSSIFGEIMAAVGSAPTLRDAVDAGIDTAFEVIGANGELVAFTIRSPMLPEVREQTRRLGEPSLKLTAQRIEQALESGEIPGPIDPGVAARLLRGAIEAVAHHYMGASAATRAHVRRETRHFAHRALGL